MTRTARGSRSEIKGAVEAIRGESAAEPTAGAAGGVEIRLLPCRSAQGEQRRVPEARGTLPPDPGGQGPRSDLARG